MNVAYWHRASWRDWIAIHCLTLRLQYPALFLGLTSTWHTLDWLYWLSKCWDTSEQVGKQPLPWSHWYRQCQGSILHLTLWVVSPPAPVTLQQLLSQGTESQMCLGRRSLPNMAMKQWPRSAEITSGWLPCLWLGEICSIASIQNFICLLVKA